VVAERAGVVSGAHGDGVHILGIDPNEDDNTRNGPPVRIVDRGGEPVREVLNQA